MCGVNMEFVVTLSDFICVGIYIALAMIFASLFTIRKTVVISVGIKHAGNKAINDLVISQSGKFDGRAAELIDIQELQEFICENQGLVDPEIRSIRILGNKYSIHLRK